MEDNEGGKIQEAMERPSVNSGRDSGVGSCKGLSNDETGVTVDHPGSTSLEGKLSQYVTSTPKKEFRIPSIMVDQAVLPSKMILDDPLLSSIDEPGGDLTDHQVDSLVSDDDCDDISTKVFNTKLKIDLDSPSKKSSLLSRFMDDVSIRPKVKRSRSFSGPLRASVSEELDRDSIKKNLFDIPVSPKLKCRVRERLYTLVNSIEGFKGRVKFDEEEEERRKLHSKTFGSVLDHSQSENWKQGNGQGKNSEIFSQTKNPLSANSDHTNYFKQQKEENLEIQSKQQCHTSLNQSIISSLNNTMSERYGLAMSTMLEAQLRQLQLHQEQLNQEKINFALQKKEEEASARIALYRNKLHEMVQLVEDLESKMNNSERKRQKETQVFEDKLQYQEEKHKQNMSLLRLECERKVHEAESRLTVAREEAAKSFDSKVMDILSENRKRLEHVEKEHQSHILDLNAVISKLRAEKREIELSFDNAKEERQLLSNVKEISNERDALKQEVEELRNRLIPRVDIENRVSKQEEYISMIELVKRKQDEEINIWKTESKKWQQKFFSLESDQHKLVDKSVQELQVLSQKEMERVKKEHNQEREKLESMIGLLQEKLSESLTKNSEFQQQRIQLRNILKQQKEYLESIESLQEEVSFLKTKVQDSEQTVRQERKTYLRLQQRHTEEMMELKEHHKQEMLKLQMILEKERSLAVSEALSRRQEETQVLMKEMEKRYQELLENVQGHCQAQIEEYKKAVRILKQRLKKSEGGEST